MRAEGIKRERETIISFNEADEAATAWTESATVYRRLLRRLGYACLVEDGERHAIFTFPKELIILPRQKTKRRLTPSQRAKLAGRMAGTAEKQGVPDIETASSSGSRESASQARQTGSNSHAGGELRVRP